MSIAKKIYKRLDPTTTHTPDRDFYLWIWYFLLNQQPVAVLKTSLKELEEASQSDLPAHVLAEYAWKAEAIEGLLK